MMTRAGCCCYRYEFIAGKQLLVVSRNTFYDRTRDVSKSHLYEQEHELS